MTIHSQLGPFHYPRRYRVPSGGTVRGSLRPPPSKSMSHRYLNLSLLAGHPTVVVRPLLAQDIELFLAALRRCGFTVERQAEEVRLTPGPPGASAGPTEIDCGNAGTMYRFVVASLATRPGEWVVDGTPRLRERPIEPLVDALRRLGARIDYLGEEGRAPLRIHGGELAGGRTRLEARDSSQYLSALLMAGIAAASPVEIEVASLSSSPYVELTVQALARFGATVERRQSWYRISPTTLSGGLRVVEGDYSAAAYPAAAAALTAGEVVLEGLDPESAQGDRRFIDLLAQLGATIEWQGDGVRVTGGSELVGVSVDLGDMPDQVPTLAAMAGFCRGTTRILGVPHLRLKESDRLRAMALELGKLGVAIEEQEEGLVIDTGRQSPLPESEVVVDSHDDHRVAMSLALVGLRRPGVVIDEPGVVAKSYPAFWEDLEHLLTE